MTPLAELAGGVGIGVALTLVAEAVRRWLQQSVVEVLLLSDREPGRLLEDHLPIFDSAGPDRFVVLRVRNRSWWGVAKQCIPYVVFLGDEIQGEIRANGVWEWRRRFGHARDISEDARDIGPGREERYTCLAVSSRGIFYYDAGETGTDASTVWHLVSNNPTGRFEMLTFVGSPNSKRLLGRHYYVECVLDNAGKPDVFLHGEGKPIDFGCLSIHTLLLGLRTTGSIRGRTR